MELPIFEICFSCCRSRRTHTAWTEYNEKIGLFTRHPRISTERTDINQEQQTQARCDSMEMDSTTRQGAAGPAPEVQCSRPADYTQTPTGQGYDNPRHINNKISVSFSEGLTSAVSLQNRQLRITLPTIKLLVNSKIVRVSPQTRQNHSRHDIQAKELPQLLLTQPVRLQDPQTKKWSISGEVLSRAETSHSHLVKTPKGVLRQNRIQIKEVPYQSTQLNLPWRVVNHHIQLMCLG